MSDSAPARVVVAVDGVVGDSCNTLKGVKQERKGNTVTVTITAERKLGGVCQELAQLYQETIRLEGDFPPGEYTVNVNGVKEEFTVGPEISQAAGTEEPQLNQAARAARNTLAAKLGVDKAELTVVSIEKVEWSDTRQ